MESPCVRRIVFQSQLVKLVSRWNSRQVQELSFISLRFKFRRMQKQECSLPEGYMCVMWVRYSVRLTYFIDDITKPRPLHLNAFKCMNVDELLIDVEFLSCMLSLVADIKMYQLTCMRISIRVHNSISYNIVWSGAILTWMLMCGSSVLRSMNIHEFWVQREGFHFR